MFKPLHLSYSLSPKFPGILLLHHYFWMVRHEFNRHSDDIKHLKQSPNYAYIDEGTNHYAILWLRLRNFRPLISTESISSSLSEVSIIDVQFRFVPLPLLSFTSFRSGLFSEVLPALIALRRPVGIVGTFCSDQDADTNT